MIKEVEVGGLIPAWYGVAWVRFDVEKAVCLPMPFNVLAAVVRALAIWMRYGYRPVAYFSRDAYAQGLRDGKRGRA